MATKIKKNIEKGKDSVWFSDGEGLRGIEHMGGLTPSPSPNGEGSSMRGYPYWLGDRRRRVVEPTEDIQGYLGNHSPLQSERGWG